jgi:hypothetical protein
MWRPRKCLTLKNPHRRMEKKAKLFVISGARGGKSLNRIRNPHSARINKILLEAHDCLEQTGVHNHSTLTMTLCLFSWTGSLGFPSHWWELTFQHVSHFGSINSLNFPYIHSQIWKNVYMKDIECVQWTHWIHIYSFSNLKECLHDGHTMSSMNSLNANLSILKSERMFTWGRE